MYQLILIIHVLAALSLIGLVLIQQGKGATVGAAFGSGASQTVFGSRGSGSFLLKVTIGFVLVFFATSIILNNMTSHAAKRASQEINLPMEAPLPAPGKTTEVSLSNLPVMPEQPIGNSKTQ